MTFAAPLFLLATLAAGIPVILHLINRQQAKHMPFSTLRFLRISAQRTRRRKQIHDVLLMLVRTAALALIAFGLSKPTLTNLTNLFGGTNTAVGIVLDNSASMGLIDSDRLRFETARQAVNQILNDHLGEGDLVALWVTCGPGFPEEGKLKRTQEDVRQMVAQTSLSYEKADVAARVLQARRELAKCDAPNKQVFVVSDMQAVSWETMESASKISDQQPAAASDQSLARSKEEQEREREVALVFVDCSRAPKPNVAVQKVAIDAAVPVAGVQIKASVEIFNLSSVAQQPRVELFIDGNKELSSPAVSIPAEGRATHDFLFTFKSGGLHRGEVRLVGEDGSKLDDRRWFTMEVDQGIPVAIVKSQRHEISYLEDSYYLERALGPGRSGNWALRTTVLTADDLPNEPLNAYKVVYCVNLPALEDDTAEKLRAYVQHGGHVVWICGENVNPEAYNQMNQKAGGQLLPATLVEVRSPTAGDRDSWTLNYLDPKYPALSQLVDPPSLHQSVLVYRHVRLDVPQTPGNWILGRLDDGEPLLVQRRNEQGSVILLGTGCHLAWTNLPLRPIFLPLFARLTFELAGGQQARYEGLAGVPLVLTFEHEIRPLGVEVVPPSGEMVRRGLQEHAGAKAEFRYPETHDVGVYLLRLLQAVSARQIGYAVNVDPTEADPKKIAREEIQQLFAPEPLVWAENPDDLKETFQWLRQGKSLWDGVLTVVLIVLVFEVFLSNRLSPKSTEEQELSKLPPGMRRLANMAR